MLVFNESIDLSSGHDRYRLHKIIDEMFYMVIAEVDKDEEIILREDELDLDNLDFNHDLEIHDFHLIDLELEDLQKDKERMHELVSNQDKEGLINHVSCLPFKIVSKEDAGLKPLLNSGELEDIVARHIFRKYDDYEVEHSRSATNSNSFYIVDLDENKVLKISDHNTDIQRNLYGTPFINVYKYKDIESILERIDKVLQ